jgi:formamidopyrimidine-DNA glycosylase
MPELPEVETIVRTLRPRLAGRRIADFASTWPRNVLPNEGVVRGRTIGRTICGVTRRGKFIILQLDDGTAVLVHLRMSGRLAWDDETQDRPNHVRAWWRLDDGRRLLFCDARKFGRITFAHDFEAATAGLGPEPLERSFTVGRLAALLRARRRQLKPLLLDQTVIAGLGNIYTDEALFRARLHPLVSAHRLKSDQITRLHAAIRQVLRDAIRRHGTSIDWIYPGGWMQRHLRVYGRGGQPCRACGTPIQTLRIGQRGTHVCPKCQRSSKFKVKSSK